MGVSFIGSTILGALRRRSGFLASVVGVVVVGVAAVGVVVVVVTATVAAGFAAVLFASVAVVGVVVTGVVVVAVGFLSCSFTNLGVVGAALVLAAEAVGVTVAGGVGASAPCFLLASTAVAARSIEGAGLLPFCVVFKPLCMDLPREGPGAATNEDFPHADALRWKTLL